jgi:Ubiquitinol-cytochrome C reductase Fe-S subunit TAT signal
MASATTIDNPSRREFLFLATGAVAVAAVAPLNLAVPGYKFLSDAKVKIG